ncbi:MAG: hypothetical protein LBS66_01850 [Rhodospirillaceae bacterium]|jgi:hypothetical protein|nr:hypothetical protein [Rhodospirillaceae bacterium]
MKLLKILVFSMGLLIISGLVTLCYGIYHSTFWVNSSKVVTNNCYSVDLPIGINNHVKQIVAIDKNVILRVNGVAEDRILVIDSNTGSLIGTITLIPQNSLTE